MQPRTKSDRTNATRYAQKRLHPANKSDNPEQVIPPFREQRKKGITCTHPGAQKRRPVSAAKMQNPFAERVKVICS
jgi:hypothetical protein